MKTTRKLLALLAILIVAFTAFAACVEPEEGEKTIKVILIAGDGTGTVFTEVTDVLYLGQALDEMVAEGDITMTANDSTYGRFVVTIGGLTPSETQWIAINSDETDPTLTALDGEYTPEITYEGKTYYSTLVGIDDMPIYDGKTYVFSIAG